MFFGAHVALEFVKLARVRGAREAKKRALLVRREQGEKVKEGETDAEREEERHTVQVELEKLRIEDAGWQTSLQINTAYAPLCVHWSKEGGFVSDTLYGLLGSWAAGLYVRNVWRATA